MMGYCTTHTTLIFTLPYLGFVKGLSNHEETNYNLETGVLPGEILRKTPTHMTGGTVIPNTARVRISSPRTTATVNNRNLLRPSSDSVRIGWR